MKKLTQFLCILLVIGLFFVMPVSAIEDGENRASHYFMETNAYLVKTSSTGFEAWFEVTGVDEMDKIGANVVKIQRSYDGEAWTTVATYTKEANPKMIDSNSTYHNFYFAYPAVPGYYYRAYVEFYAKKGSGSGTYYNYSPELAM